MEDKRFTGTEVLAIVLFTIVVTLIVFLSGYQFGKGVIQ